MSYNKDYGGHWNGTEQIGKGTEVREKELAPELKKWRWDGEGLQPEQQDQHL